MIQKIIILALVLPLLGFGTANSEAEKINFINVTSIVTYDEFERVKAFILEKGDKMTYRNYDNDNPHYRFKDIDAYLGADIGQRNIGNDPNISDFNELYIAGISIIIVRKGDIRGFKAWVQTGMEEGQVYVINPYNKDLSLIKESLRSLMQVVREEVKKTVE